MAGSGFRRVFTTEVEHTDYSQDHKATKLAVAARKKFLEEQILRLEGKRVGVMRLRNMWYTTFDRGVAEKVAALRYFIQQLEQLEARLAAISLEQQMEGDYADDALMDRHLRLSDFPGDAPRTDEKLIATAESVSGGGGSGAVGVDKEKKKEEKHGGDRPPHDHATASGLLSAATLTAASDVGDKRKKDKTAQFAPLLGPPHPRLSHTVALRRGAELLTELAAITDDYESVMELSASELSVQRYGWLHTAAGTLPIIGGAVGGMSWAAAHWSFSTMAGTLLPLLGGPWGLVIAGVIGLLLSRTRLFQKILPWGDSTRGEDNATDPTRDFEKELLKGHSQPLKLTSGMQRLQAISKATLPGYVLKTTPAIYVEKTAEDKKKESDSSCGNTIRKWAGQPPVVAVALKEKEGAVADEKTPLIGVSAAAASVVVPEKEPKVVLVKRRTVRAAASGVTAIVGSGGMGSDDHSSSVPLISSTGTSGGMSASPLPSLAHPVDASPTVVTTYRRLPQSRVLSTKRDWWSLGWFMKPKNPSVARVTGQNDYVRLVRPKMSRGG